MHLITLIAIIWVDESSCPISVQILRNNRHRDREAAIALSRKQSAVHDTKPTECTCRADFECAACAPKWAGPGAGGPKDYQVRVSVTAQSPLLATKEQLHPGVHPGQEEVHPRKEECPSPGGIRMVVPVEGAQQKHALQEELAARPRPSQRSPQREAPHRGDAQKQQSSPRLPVTRNRATQTDDTAKLVQNGTGTDSRRCSHLHKTSSGSDEKLHLAHETSIASVAYLLLFADGLHNFMDGLAIGSGFTNSVATGVGITLAVLCEEVPHEVHLSVVSVQNSAQIF